MAKKIKNVLIKNKGYLETFFNTASNQRPNTDTKLQLNLSRIHGLVNTGEHFAQVQLLRQCQTRLTHTYCSTVTQVVTQESHDTSHRFGTKYKVPHEAKIMATKDALTSKENITSESNL